MCESCEHKCRPGFASIASRRPRRGRTTLAALSRGRNQPRLESASAHFRSCGERCPRPHDSYDLVPRPARTLVELAFVWPGLRYLRLSASASGGLDSLAGAFAKSVNRERRKSPVLRRWRKLSGSDFNESRYVHRMECLWLRFLIFFA